MREMRRSTLLLAVLLACGDKATGDSGSDSGEAGGIDVGGDEGGGDAGGGDVGGGTGGDAGGSSGGSTSDVPPIVAGVDAWCHQHTTGEERWIWRVTATAFDEQGLDTLMAFVEDGVVVSQAGAEVARYPLACDLTTGACSTQFEQSQHGVLCSAATSYTIGVEALDEDDNRSDTVTVTGRQGAGPDGR